MADTISFGIKADDQTRRGFASVERGLNRLGGVAKSAFGIARTGAVVLTAATVGLATATALLTKREAELIKEIKLVSDTTGIAVKQVSAWTEEFRRFGLEAEDTRDILNELNVKQNDALAGTESAIEAFAVFGLSLQDIAGLNAHETLLAIADGFQTVEDHSRAAWAADAIFGGDMAQRTIPILLQGRDALLENARAAEMLGLVYDEKAVAAAERFDRAQFGLGQQIRSLGTAIATAAMPHLTNLMNAFSVLIKFGREFAGLLPAIVNGAISFSEGFDQAFQRLPPSVQRAMAVTTTNFVTALNNLLAGVWNFAGKVEGVVVNIVNDVINSVPGLADVIGTASGSAFGGAPPTVKLPQTITDFLTQEVAPTTAWTTQGGGGGQTYTVQPGDTYSHIASRTGLSVDQLRRQVGQPDTGLQIGTDIRYGGGGARRTSAITPDMAQRMGLAPAGDPELLGLHQDYLASLRWSPPWRFGRRDYQAIYQTSFAPPPSPPAADNPFTANDPTNQAIQDFLNERLGIQSGDYLWDSFAQIPEERLGITHLPDAGTPEELEAYRRRRIYDPLAPQQPYPVGATWANYLRNIPSGALTENRSQDVPQVVVNNNNITVEVNDTEDFITRLNDALESGAALPFLIQEQQRNE